MTPRIALKLKLHHKSLKSSLKYAINNKVTVIKHHYDQQFNQV